MTDKHTPKQRIVAQFTDQCGCSVTGTDEKKRLAFNRCPLHAAAPELLKALEESGTSFPDTGWHSWSCIHSTVAGRNEPCSKQCELARAAMLKAAKGDA